MSKRAKKVKREAYEPSSAAKNVARVVADFDSAYYVLEAVAGAADREYAELVETAEDAVEYLETVPDAAARLLVYQLRNDLEKVTPPKNSDGQTEEKLAFLPDPKPKEREAAIGYLIVRMNPEFSKMVLGLNEDKTALARGDDTHYLEIFKEMLREVGFRWTDGYFERQWTKLIEEAAQRQAA